MSGFWTLSRRIAAGIAGLVLVTAIVGGVSLWRLAMLRGDVQILAGNTVPSIVTLIREIEANFRSLEAVQAVVVEGEDTAARERHERAFREQVAKGAALCADYESLLSDDTDTRIFREARAAREAFVTSAEEAFMLAREGRREEARTLVRDVVEPAAMRCLDLFDADIDHNISLSDALLAGAQFRMRSGLIAVAAAVAAAILLGIVLGGGLIRSIGGMLRSLSDALEQGSERTAAAATRAAEAGRTVAEGCGEQGAAVAETGAALEQMAAMIRSTADNASQATTLARQARSAADAGARTMLEMDEAMRAIESSSGEVAKIVKQIDEIAFQTNILALNAAVEAARAGEAGAGFAVVADEVRSLAQRSAAAARETAARIESAIASSRRGAATCGDVGRSLGEIAAAVGSADTLVAEIATAAREQSQGIGQIGTAMGQLDSVTQSNAARAEEGALAAGDLATEAVTLLDHVGRLRRLVGGGGTPPDATVKAGAVAVPAPRPLGLPHRPAGGAPVPRIPMPGDAESDAGDRHFRDFG
jgi:methyl-accepting chemotaxis protein